jgi:GTP:adenosylcobinamide-phosphate guanylyltransferase
MNATTAIRPSSAAAAPLTETVHAILPAGGRIAGGFADAAGVTIKTLIRGSDGQTLLARIIEALRKSGRVERIAVVGTHDDPGLRAAAARADTLLPEGDSGPDNIFRALDWLRAGSDSPLPQRVLIVTTDLPFVTPDAIADLIDRCSPEADICVPVIERDEFERRFPGSINEWVRLRDGQWTIGGAFLVRPDALLRSRVQIDRAFAARKSQLAMARLLGPIFIARFLTRRLGVADIEARCARILGCRGQAVRSAAPELAFDIDTVDDWRYATAQQSSITDGG